jgi:hypothetical protein
MAVVKVMLARRIEDKALKTKRQRQQLRSDTGEFLYGFTYPVRPRRVDLCDFNNFRLPNAPAVRISCWSS